MNLATLLIPVLFMGGQLIAVQLLQKNGPVGIENPGDELVHPVALRIEVTATALRLWGAEEILAGPEGRPELRCEGDCAPGAYDDARLRRLLRHVKRAYPWVDRITIQADADIGVALVAELQQAAATDEGRPLFPKVQLTTR